MGVGSLASIAWAGAAWQWSVRTWEIPMKVLERRWLQITTNLTVSRGSSNPATQSSVEYDNSWGGANGVYQLVWKACG